jgi:hypothetical protein
LWRSVLGSPAHGQDARGTEIHLLFELEAIDVRADRGLGAGRSTGEAARDHGCERREERGRANDLRGPARAVHD